MQGCNMQPLLNGKKIVYITKNPNYREIVFGVTSYVMGMILHLPPFQIQVLLLSCFACSHLCWQAQFLVGSGSAETCNCCKYLVTMEAA